MKKRTTILIDEGLFLQVKQVGINISGFVNDALINFLSEKEVYENSIPVLLKEEVSKFVEIATYRKNWEDFLVSQCLVIKTRTGLVITPSRLKALIKKDLIDKELKYE